MSAWDQLHRAAHTRPDTQTGDGPGISARDTTMDSNGGLSAKSQEPPPMRPQRSSDRHAQTAAATGESGLSVKGSSPPARPPRDISIRAIQTEHEVDNLVNKTEMAQDVDCNDEESREQLVQEEDTAKGGNGADGGPMDTHEAQDGVHIGDVEAQDGKVANAYGSQEANDVHFEMGDPHMETQGSNGNENDSSNSGSNAGTSSVPIPIPTAGGASETHASVNSQTNKQSKSVSSNSSSTGLPSRLSTTFLPASTILNSPRSASLSMSSDTPTRAASVTSRTTTVRTQDGTLFEENSQQQQQQQLSLPRGNSVNLPITSSINVTSAGDNNIDDVIAADDEPRESTPATTTTAITSNSENNQSTQVNSDDPNSTPIVVSSIPEPANLPTVLDHFDLEALENYANLTYEQLGPPPSYDSSTIGVVLPSGQCPSYNNVTSYPLMVIPPRGQQSSRNPATTAAAAAATTAPVPYTMAVSNNNSNNNNQGQATPPRSNSINHGHISHLQSNGGHHPSFSNSSLSHSIHPNHQMGPYQQHAHRGSVGAIPNPNALTTMVPVTTSSNNNISNSNSGFISDSDNDARSIRSQTGSIAGSDILIMGGLSISNTDLSTSNNNNNNVNNLSQSQPNLLAASGNVNGNNVTVGRSSSHIHRHGHHGVHLRSASSSSSLGNFSPAQLQQQQQQESLRNRRRESTASLSSLNSINGVTAGSNVSLISNGASAGAVGLPTMNDNTNQQIPAPPIATDEQHQPPALFPPSYTPGAMGALFNTGYQQQQQQAQHVQHAQQTQQAQPQYQQAPNAAYSMNHPAGSAYIQQQQQLQQQQFYQRVIHSPQYHHQQQMLQQQQQQHMAPQFLQQIQHQQQIQQMQLLQQQHLQQQQQQQQNNKYSLPRNLAHLQPYLFPPTSNSGNGNGNGSSSRRSSNGGASLTRVSSNSSGSSALSTSDSRQVEKRKFEIRKAIIAGRHEFEDLRNRIRRSPDGDDQLLFARELVNVANDVNTRIGDIKRNRKYQEALYSEAYKWIKKLATNGPGNGNKKPNSDAQFFLAECYGDGLINLNVDHERAFSMYQQAAKLSHPEANYRVGVCYEYGAGVKKDIKKALLFYAQSANLGEPLAMLKLGEVHLHGLFNQPKSIRDAVLWFKKTIATDVAKCPAACYYLAKMYEGQLSWGQDGRLHASPESQEIADIVTLDLTKAVENYFQAAHHGHAASQYRVGYFFEYGCLGLPQDPRLSIAWYWRAVEQNNMEAQFAIAGWYLTGSPGVMQQNDFEAYAWNRRAAERGYARAVFMVAYFSEYAVGLARASNALNSTQNGEPDLQEARRWYLRAASMGNKIARQRVAEMNEAIKSSKSLLPNENSCTFKLAKNCGRQGEWRKLRSGNQALVLNDREVEFM